MHGAMVYTNTMGKRENMAEDSKREGVSMKLSDIQKLIDMLDKSGVNELEIENEGMKLRLCKAAPAAQPAHSPQFIMVPSPMVPGTGRQEIVFPAGSPAPSTSPSPAAPAQPGPSFGEAPPPAHPPKSDQYLQVKSPMVGTFYRSPAPGAEPFVKIGDRVKKGKTLCIIEAMKLMNEIESEVDGVVVDILTENAQPVEYGEALFLVDPAS